jgi:hypothetical protein
VQKHRVSLSPKEKSSMKNLVKHYCLFFLLFLSSSLQSTEQKPYVVGNLLGQAGNNFFQIATASALAWDNNADPYFPGLAIIPSLYQHYFSHCKINPLSKEISFNWQEPSNQYTPIPYQDNMSISGYVQSWKYFDHHRDRLLTLFAPPKKDIRYIKKKYGHLLSQNNTVGIQIRYYMKEAPSYAQYGRDYLEEAMALFPETSLFIVSSNDLSFAKSQVPIEGRNVIFLEGEPAYIDFHLLTLCKDMIITNSTFGWWIAYLNQNPNKTIICPDVSEMYPESWIQLQAKKVTPIQ